MTTESNDVIGGVDTHKHTHYGAVIDDQGRLLGHRQFPASDRGYAALLEWMRSYGRIRAIGVQSTGPFGATLTRSLTAAGERVIEVNRPNRVSRRMDGKSDRLDAEQIARAVLGQTSTAIPEVQVRNGGGDPHVARHPRQRRQSPYSGL
jgi:transposase